jgi:hypothetical protein
MAKSVVLRASGILRFATLNVVPANRRDDG